MYLGGGARKTRPTLNLSQDFFPQDRSRPRWVALCSSAFQGAVCLWANIASPFWGHVWVARSGPWTPAPTERGKLPLSVTGKKFLTV
jgi:hypothetical protein